MALETTLEYLAQQFDPEAFSQVKYVASPILSTSEIPVEISPDAQKELGEVIKESNTHPDLEGTEAALERDREKLLADVDAMIKELKDVVDKLPQDNSDAIGLQGQLQILEEVREIIAKADELGFWTRTVREYEAQIREYATNLTGDSRVSVTASL